MKKCSPQTAAEDCKSTSRSSLIGRVDVFVRVRTGGIEPVSRRSPKNVCLNVHSSADRFDHNHRGVNTLESRWLNRCEPVRHPLLSCGVVSGCDNKWHDRPTRFSCHAGCQSAFRLPLAPSTKIAARSKTAFIQSPSRLRCLRGDIIAMRPPDNGRHRRSRTLIDSR